MLVLRLHGRRYQRDQSTHTVADAIADAVSDTLADARSISKPDAIADAGADAVSHTGAHPVANALANSVANSIANAPPHPGLSVQRRMPPQEYMQGPAHGSVQQPGAVAHPAGPRWEWQLDCPRWRQRGLPLRDFTRECRCGARVR